MNSNEVLKGKSQQKKEQGPHTATSSEISKNNKEDSKRIFNSISILRNANLSYRISLPIFQI